MPSVSVTQLSKSYNSIKALDNVSFDVSEGELFGIIGPDGAGKTTLFRLLTTLILPDGGSAVIEGLDVVKDYAAVRHIIGYMPGKFSLYQDLTVEENLNFFAMVFNTTVKENYHLIEDIYKHIEPFRTRRAGKLSGGMKQKLALSCALIHKPKVLFYYRSRSRIKKGILGNASETEEPGYNHYSLNAVYGRSQTL